MSKKSMILVGVAVLAVVAIAAALFVTSRKPSSQTATTGAPSSSATTGTSTATNPAGAPGQTATATTTTTGTASTGPGTNGAGSTPSKIGPFKPLPDPKIPAQKPTSPAAPGATLAPLLEAPPGTISALKSGVVPDGTEYVVVMRPYGIGPSLVLGSQLAIRVDSAKPNSKYLSDRNLLVLVDTTHRGTVTKGGTYTATITFRSDGKKLIPILSLVKAQ